MLDKQLKKGHPAALWSNEGTQWCYGVFKDTEKTDRAFGDTV